MARYRKLTAFLTWTCLATPAWAEPAADAAADANAAAPTADTPKKDDEGEATTAIRAANDRLRKLLADEKHTSKEITKALHGLLDIKLLAQRALVNHWDKMSGKQQKDIVETLQAIIEKNYLNQIRDNINYGVDYLGEQPKGDSVVVRSIIRATRNGRPSKISVDYRLRQEGTTWHIYDVITEEVSILDNYRSQFNRIIAKDGVDGLISRMKSKLQA